MAAPVIKHPRPPGGGALDDLPATPQNSFAVSGRADANTVSVTGSVTPQAGGAAIPGKTIYLMNGDNGYRWVILFTGVAAGTYTLNVTGAQTGGGNLSAPPVNFTVSQARRIGIAWPLPNTSISSYASDFTPYGSLSAGVPLQSVTLHNDTDGGYIGLIYSYSDSTDYDIWTAQFASLPAGNSYTLRATDCNGNQAPPSTGLTT